MSRKYGQSQLQWSHGNEEYLGKQNLLSKLLSLHNDVIDVNTNLSQDISANLTNYTALRINLQIQICLIIYIFIFFILLQNICENPHSIMTLICSFGAYFLYSSFTSQQQNICQFKS